MSEEQTYINGLPTEVELNVTIEILNRRKFIDFDFLTYNRRYKIEEVSTIISGIEYDDEYLFHKLILKCEKAYLFDNMNAKLRKILENNPTYMYVDPNE
jgi:hypothetical protein